MMFEDEGSRSEFLRLLVGFGEEPAFIARALAPQIALDALLGTCEAKRNEMLKWPRLRLSALAYHVGANWSRLSPLLAAPASVTMLETLHAEMPNPQPVHADWLVTDKIALHRFLESARRFNRGWQLYLHGLDLEPVNRPRRDFNQYCLLEKDCAFASTSATERFEPLAMIDYEYLIRRFPLLTLPSLV